MQTSIFCYRLLGCAAVITLLLSCGGAKSSSTAGPTGGPVPTSRMTINLRVESSEPGITVVRANVNDGQFLGESFRLDGGDFFRACFIGVCRNMAGNDSIVNPDYIARFDYQPGVDYVVSFNRKRGGNAPDSRVAMPPAFTLVTPANHQQVTDGDTVVVEWSPTGAPALVAVNYSANCTFASGPDGFSFGNLSIDANGDGRESVSIDPIVTFARSTSGPPTRCSIDLTVSHQLQGRIDPAFHGGTALGIVSRKVNLDYVPR